MKKFYLSIFWAIGLWSWLSLAVTAQQPVLKSSTVVTGDLLDADAAPDFTAVLYTRSGNIYYNQMDLNGEWMQEVLLGLGTEATVAVDHLNAVHVAYVEKDTLYHRTYNATVWSDRDTIASLSLGGTGKCSKPDIAVDNIGGVHLTYTDSHGSSGDNYIYPDIMYAKKTDGNFAIQLIHRGYRDYSSSGSWAADYFSKGSYITVTANGDYFIMAHQQNIYRWYAGTDNTYFIRITSNLGTGSLSNYGTDIFTIHSLNFDGNKVWALYKQTTFKISELTVSGTVISFTNTQDVTATSVSSLMGNITDLTTGGTSGSNLLTLFNDFSHAYTDVVVKGTRVSVVEVNGSFFAFYTDNADGAIKMREVARPLSVMSFALAEQTAPALISIKDATIAIKVPEGTDLTGLVPSFSTTADVETVKIGEVDQTSGSSAVDFSLPVTYALNSAGGSRNWTVTVSYEVPSAVAESAASLVTLYPNPFTQTVHISAADAVKRVEVKNLLGQTVAQSTPGNIATINTSLLDKGVYLFVVELNNGDVVVQKMQKQ